jgi:hypothetical protein
MLKVNRDIPLPWLIGGAVFLIAQAVTLIGGQQQQASNIKELTTELKELRSAAVAGGLKNVEFDLKITDHERRLQTLERKAPQ